MVGGLDGDNRPEWADETVNELNRFVDLDGVDVPRTQLTTHRDTEPAPLLKRYRTRVFTVVIFTAIIASVVAAFQQRENRPNDDEDVSIIADVGAEPDDSSEDDAPATTEVDGLLSGAAVESESDTTTPSDSATFGSLSETTPLSAIVTSVPEIPGTAETTAAPSSVGATSTTETQPTVTVTTEVPTTATTHTTAPPATAPPTTAAPPTTLAPKPSWSPLYQYDFGPAGSPVKAGFTPVDPNRSGHINFSGGPVLATNRASGSALKRDLVFASGQRSFNHGLPNGTYRVSVTMGDAEAHHDEMTVQAEGVVFSNGTNTVAGEFKTLVSVVIVTDGELKIVFADKGGLDPNWVLNAITIEVDANNLPR